jgi:hypothetical protein
MDELTDAVLTVASGSRSKGGRDIPPLAWLGGIGGAAGAIAVAQLLATTFPHGPYLALALPMLALVGGVLLARRLLRVGILRAAAVGFAIGGVLMLLLFAGAG